MSASSSQALEVTRDKMLSAKPCRPAVLFLAKSVRDLFMLATLVTCTALVRLKSFLIFKTGSPDQSGLVLGAAEGVLVVFVCTL